MVCKCGPVLHDNDPLGLDSVTACHPSTCFGSLSVHLRDAPRTVCIFLLFIELSMQPSNVLSIITYITSYMSMLCVIVNVVNISDFVHIKRQSL